MGPRASARAHRNSRIIIDIYDALELGEEYAITHLSAAVSTVVGELIEDDLLPENSEVTAETTLIDLLHQVYAEAVIVYMLFDGLTYDNSHHRPVLDFIFSSVCSVMQSCIDFEEDTDYIALISDDFPVRLDHIDDYDTLCEQISVALMDEIEFMDVTSDERYERQAYLLRENILCTLCREFDPDDDFNISWRRKSLTIVPARLIRR